MYRYFNVVYSFVGSSWYTHRLAVVLLGHFRQHQISLRTQMAFWRNTMGLNHLFEDNSYFYVAANSRWYYFFNSWSFKFYKYVMETQFMKVKRWLTGEPRPAFHLSTRSRRDLGTQVAPNVTKKGKRSYQKLLNSERNVFSFFTSLLNSLEDGWHFLSLTCSL